MILLEEYWPRRDQSVRGIGHESSALLTNNVSDFALRVISLDACQSLCISLSLSLSPQMVHLLRLEPWDSPTIKVVWNRLAVRVNCLGSVALKFSHLVNLFRIKYTFDAQRGLLILEKLVAWVFLLIEIGCVGKDAFI